VLLLLQSKYIYFYLLILAGTILGYTTAQFFAALLPTPKLVFAAWPMFFILFSNFAGYAVRLPNVGIGWRWVSDQYMLYIPYYCVDSDVTL
jgi:hypothetical protein